MLEFIQNYWGFAPLTVLIVHGAVIFFSKPRKKRLKLVRRWLLWAVAKAEVAMADSDGAGQLKLSMVYDSFMERFPAIARQISYEQFSEMVDDALDTLDDEYALVYIADEHKYFHTKVRCGYEHTEDSNFIWPRASCPGCKRYN